MRTALVFALGSMLMLSACAKPPSQTRNACAIFEQRDGLFNNWRRRRPRIPSANTACRCRS